MYYVYILCVLGCIHVCCKIYKLHLKCTSQLPWNSNIVIVVVKYNILIRQRSLMACGVDRGIAWLTIFCRTPMKALSHLPPPSKTMQRWPRGGDRTLQVSGKHTLIFLFLFLFLPNKTICWHIFESNSVFSSRTYVSI